jgi:hypothetical protein
LFLTRKLTFPKALPKKILFFWHKLAFWKHYKKFNITYFDKCVEEGHSETPGSLKKNTLNLKMLWSSRELKNRLWKGYIL